jgi:hypothetical protein
MAGSAKLDPLYLNFFTTAEYRFLKGKSEVLLQALPLLRDTLSCPAKKRVEATPERFENISKPTKTKIREAFLNVYSAVPIIHAPFLGIGEDLIGLVYFLKFGLGTVIFVAIRVVLES